ncbi:hypothetical protein CN098_06825, partial [Sinorhizobium meliloti]
ACAWLRADVGCYSFIVTDFHHLLLAGLPAHCHSAPSRNRPQLACGKATRSRLCQEGSTIHRATRSLGHHRLPRK